MEYKGIKYWFHANGTVLVKMKDGKFMSFENEKEMKNYIEEENNMNMNPIAAIAPAVNNISIDKIASIKGATRNVVVFVDYNRRWYFNMKCYALGKKFKGNNPDTHEKMKSGSGIEVELSANQNALFGLLQALEQFKDNSGTKINEFHIRTRHAFIANAFENHYIKQWESDFWHTKEKRVQNYELWKLIVKEFKRIGYDYDRVTAYIVQPGDKYESKNA